MFRISVFIICWSPYFIFNFLYLLGYIPHTKVMGAISTFVQNLAPLNSAANPIIYGIFSTRICRYLKWVCVCCLYNVMWFVWRVVVVVFSCCSCSCIPIRTHGSCFPIRKQVLCNKNRWNKCLSSLSKRFSLQNMHYLTVDQTLYIQCVLTYWYAYDKRNTKIAWQTKYLQMVWDHQGITSSVVLLSISKLC